MRNRAAGVTAKPKHALSAAAVAGLAGLALAPAAHADEALIAAAAVTEVAPLAVRAADSQPASPKLTQPLLETPQTIAIIPAEVIREQGATTLRDVLRNVSGISMQAGEGGAPNGDQLTLRGFSARTDMFIDGVRDIGGYTRDPFNLEQVEVAKGPASAYSGRGSTGGSINQVSKTPHLADFGALDVSAGTNELGRVTLDVNRVIDEAHGIAVRLNVMGHSADVARRDYVHNGRWGVAPSLALGLGTATRLTFSHLYMSQDNVPDYGIPWVRDNNTAVAQYAGKPAPVDLSNWYGILSRDFEDIEANVTTAAIEHDFSPKAQIVSTFRYGQVERDSIVAAPRFRPASSETIFAEFKARASTDSILTNQTNLTLRLGEGFVRHVVATGFEVTRERYRNRPSSGPDAPLTDLYDPDPYRPYPAGPYTFATEQVANGDTTAIYVFDTVSLGERWMVSAGLRHDRFALDYDSGAGVFTRVDEMTSGRAALIYKPSENASLYAGYATSFNPSAEGLTLNADSALLEPEETRTYELGAKWNLAALNLNLAAAIFRTEKTNARTEDPLGGPDVLEGEQRVDGFEASATGQIAPGWTVMAAYTWLDGEITGSNDPLEQGKVTPNTPEHSLALWSTYQVGKVSVGGGLSYVGSRFSNAVNDRQAEGYWLADAMAAYDVNDSVTVRMNVYNLADEEYFDNIGGGHLIPGAGRSASVTLAYDF